MPAPDYETIFNVEAAVEAAFKTVAQNATGVSVLTAFQNVTQSGARVQVQAESGGAREQYQTDRAGRKVQSVWNIRLFTSVITDRKKAQNNRLICAKLRNAFQPFRLNLGVSALPYHALKEITDTGSQQETRGDEDVTVLSWSLVVEVRKDAWPLVS